MPIDAVVRVADQVVIFGQVRAPTAGRVVAEARFMVAGGQGQLFEIVAALHFSGRLAHRLHRWEQQGDEDSDNRDHDQQFHQGEAADVSRFGKIAHPPPSFRSRRLHRKSPGHTTDGPDRWPTPIRKAHRPAMPLGRARREGTSLRSPRFGQPSVLRHDIRSADVRDRHYCSRRGRGIKDALRPEQQGCKALRSTAILAVRHGQDARATTGPS